MVKCIELCMRPHRYVKDLGQSKFCTDFNSMHRNVFVLQTFT